MYELWEYILTRLNLPKGSTAGLWVARDKSQKPDIVIYYCHGMIHIYFIFEAHSYETGGGFSMGSSYFYLEFLLVWVSLLRKAGYRNPAIFALEYSLVPDAAYPTQAEQTLDGYKYVCSITGDASRVCVGGDSAGATLVLSLLLRLGQSNNQKLRPGYAILISPWPALLSSKIRDTKSDYLNADSLHLYGRQYALSKANLYNPLVSPGMCKDRIWWAKASPRAGFCILFGSEEVLGPEIRDLIILLRTSGCYVSTREEPGAVHAWPVATLFLSDTELERQKGLKDITKMIKQTILIGSCA